MEWEAHERLATLISEAFSSGETTPRTQRAVVDALPHCAYVSLCIPGNEETAVCTSNLVAPGFLHMSLYSVSRISCLTSNRPELLPAARMEFLPPAARITANEFVCIPIPRLPPDTPDVQLISGLTGPDHSSIGCLVLGLAPNVGREAHLSLVGTAASLVRVLAKILPGPAVDAAVNIVSFLLPVPVRPNAVSEVAAGEGPATEEGGAEVSTAASSTLDDDSSDDASSRSGSSDSSGREPRSPDTVQHTPGGRRRSGSSQREVDRSDLIASCPADVESAAATAPLTRELLAAQDSAYQVKGSKSSSVRSGPGSSVAVTALSQLSTLPSSKSTSYASALADQFGQLLAD